ncbi:MAG: hypothetical protein KGI42_07180 [Xanthomonadaceae bacterium]|nr:hypothetical protein [Xanthomonadaceae bacterium]
MARRSSSAEASLLVLAIVIGLPVYLAMKVIDVTGWVLPVVIVVAIIGLAMASRAKKRRKRIEALRRKYPEEIVQRILDGHIWQGQTEEQLIDAIGSPAEVDTKVLKTMHREIWKYGRISAKRFRLRITVENGMVAGWDQKG